MDELTLKAEKIIWRGRALSRLSSGQVVIVDPGVFPGEVFKARVTKRKKDYLQAGCVHLLESHPARRPHPCHHSTQCGGCRFGVLPNRAQLELKADLLQRELARGLPRDVRLPGVSVAQSPKGWRYRWRGQVHVKDHRPHFKALQSDRTVQLDDCFLLARPLARALGPLSQGLQDGRHIIAASPLDHSAVSAPSSRPLKLPLTGLASPCQVPAQSFFQANWSLNQHLVSTVVSLLEPYQDVADLYAGCGNFALPLAKTGKRVLAAETDGAAVAAIQANAREMGLQTLQAVQTDLTRESLAALLAPVRPEAAIVDPPRAGGGRHIAGLAGVESLSRIVWVSCDVVNSARDMRPFFEHGWEVTSLKLFDMFPQTWHMDVVMVLDRR